MRRYQTPCGTVGSWSVSILSREDPREAPPGSKTGTLTIRRVCWERAGCGMTDETEIAFENLAAVAFQEGSDAAAALKIAEVQPPNRCPVCKAREEREADG